MRRRGCLALLLCLGCSGRVAERRSVPPDAGRDAWEPRIVCSGPTTRGPRPGDDVLALGRPGDVVRCLPPPRPQPPACEALWHTVVSGPEVARRLTRWLWGRDEADGLALAERGGLNLRSDSHRDAFINQLLADPRATEGFDAFVRRWLDLRDEAPAGVPPALWSSFREETSRFLWHALMVERTVALNELLQADYTFVDARLAAHYGLPIDAGAGWTRTKVDPEQRGGLLGQGSLLARFRSAPSRGNYLWQTLFQGRPFPPPPLKAGHPETSPGPTPARAALFPAVNADSLCRQCHELVDGAGWALQHYDELGRFRTLDADGRPVDASGWLAGGAGDRVTFTGHRGLALALAPSPDAYLSFVLQVIDHAMATAPLQLVNEGHTEVLARCVVERWRADGTFRGLLSQVAGALFVDWPGPDGGAPDAQDRPAADGGDAAP